MRLPPTPRLALCALVAAALALTAACESDGTTAPDTAAGGDATGDAGGGDGAGVDVGYDGGQPGDAVVTDPGSTPDDAVIADPGSTADPGATLDIGLDGGQPDTGGVGDAAVDAGAQGEVNDHDDAGPLDVPATDGGPAPDIGDGVSTPDAGPDVPPPPCGDEDAPGCWVCGDDAPVGVAACVGGFWVCAVGVFVAELDCGTDPSCALYGGEVCCGAGGAVTDALCPSPSQPYCADGSTPQLSCNVLGQGQCRSGADCDGMGETCQGPSDPGMCGICFTPDPSEICQSDADCSAEGGVCELKGDGCLCSPEMLCTAACASSADCEVGESCQADGHCAATACTADADCPALFACQDGDSATCVRKTCSIDPECGVGGWCVKSECEAQPGFCTFPVP
jgi:hypothetical protein